MVVGLLNCFFLIGASSYAIYIFFTYFEVAPGIGSLLVLIPLGVETVTFLLVRQLYYWRRIYRRIIPLLGIFGALIIGIGYVVTLWIFLVNGRDLCDSNCTFNQAYNTQFLQIWKVYLSPKQI